MSFQSFIDLRQRLKILWSWAESESSNIVEWLISNHDIYKNLYLLPDRSEVTGFMELDEYSWELNASRKQKQAT